MFANFALQRSQLFVDFWHFTTAALQKDVKGFSDLIQIVSDFGQLPIGTAQGLDFVASQLRLPNMRQDQTCKIMIPGRKAIISLGSDFFKRNAQQTQFNAHGVRCLAVRKRLDRRLEGLRLQVLRDERPLVGFARIMGEPDKLPFDGIRVSFHDYVMWLWYQQAFDNNFATPDVEPEKPILPVDAMLEEIHSSPSAFRPGTS